MNQCSGHGACIEGDCVCHPGYKGDDCSVMGSTTSQNDTCIWPTTSAYCKIKTKDQCYFYCYSLIVAGYSILPLILIWLIS